MSDRASRLLPSNWRLLRLKHVAHIEMGQSPPSEEYSEDRDGLPFLQGAAEFGDQYPAAKLVCRTAPKRARRGDILLSVRAPVGAINVADREYGIGRGLCAIRASEGVNAEYLRLALSASTGQLASAATGSTYDAVSAQDVAGLRIPLPPVQTQAGIVAWLRPELEQTADLIRQKLRLSEVLDEKARVLSMLALTQGLDGRDMTPTDIPEIPLIPSSWRLVRNKVLFREVDERLPVGVLDPPELLSVSHLTGVTPRADKNVYMFLADSFDSYKLCHRDDLVINTMWAWMGALGISPQDGIVSPSYNVYRFRTPESLVPAYYDSLFRTPGYVAMIDRHSKGVWRSRLRLYPDAFFSLFAPVPSVEDQAAIVDRLSELLAPVRVLQRTLLRSVVAIRERASRLVQDAVHGSPMGGREAG